MQFVSHGSHSWDFQITVLLTKSCGIRGGGVGSKKSNHVSESTEQHRVVDPSTQ